ncbi:hypothetical protein OMCYN_00359 [cyanobiont of Ornithocercus magnificus]|nr:hypothetical protein OMCYN_00359 [cyanobiont of Ornithocercus magnificus]
MAKRFDALFAGMSEQKALMLARSSAKELDNPGSKYIAVTRLGACESQESLDQLVSCINLDTSDLYERIVRRKAIEALGRRQDQGVVPHLIKVLNDNSDELAVINAVDAITQIGSDLNSSQICLLGRALTGSDNQKRAVIQAHTRLKITAATNEIAVLQYHQNPLVAGAAIAYMARLHGQTSLLSTLVAQLYGDVAGHRRAAVIDIADAGDIRKLQDLAKAPVSMPLRAKSAFQLLEQVKSSKAIADYDLVLRQLLNDHPDNMYLKPKWIPGDSEEELRINIQHRDEARQYGAAKTVLQLTSEKAISVIDRWHTTSGSDYVVHYYIVLIINLNVVSARADLIRSALAETTPQYAKSRVAAAWACLHLNLTDQIPLIKELSQTAQWLPLKWSCQQVSQEMKQSVI